MRCGRAASCRFRAQNIRTRNALPLQGNVEAWPRWVSPGAVCETLHYPQCFRFGNYAGRDCLYHAGNFQFNDMKPAILIFSSSALVFESPRMRFSIGRASFSSPRPCASHPGRVHPGPSCPPAALVRSPLPAARRAMCAPPPWQAAAANRIRHPESHPASAHRAGSAPILSRTQKYLRSTERAIRG